MQRILTILTTVTTAMFVASIAIRKIKEWGKGVTEIVATNAVNSIKKCDTKMMTIIEKIRKMSDAEIYKKATIRGEKIIVTITEIITGMGTINETRTVTRRTETKVDLWSHTILELMDMHALSIGAIMSAANTNKDAIRKAIVSDKKGGSELIFAIGTFWSIAKTNMSSDELTELRDVLRSLQDILDKNYETLITIMEKVIIASASYSYSITYGNKEPKSAFMKAMYDKILRKAKVFINTIPYHDSSTMKEIHKFSEICLTIEHRITKIREFKAIIAFVIAEDRQILESLNMTECNECDTCPICLNNFDDNEEKIETSCYHQFHESCLETWKDYSKTNTFSCPLCRTTQKT